VRVQVGLLVLMSLTAVQPAWAQSRDEARLRGSDHWETDFSVASVRLSEIVSGGPPKDGIPAIERPRFESVSAAASWLGDRDPILIVEIDGVVKGYPLGILIWHEIVNDELAGVPLVVTFCPLCNTALVFDGRLGDQVLDFGTTGRLRQSDMVMYDRQTESWWQQAVGEAIVGSLTGERLTVVAANTFGWKRARHLYPDMRVLSRDTGFPSYMASGRYGQNPYRNYDSGRGPYQRFFQGSFSNDLPAMERVVAIDKGKGWAASFSDLRETGTAHGILGVCRLLGARRGQRSRQVPDCFRARHRPDSSFFAVGRWQNPYVRKNGKWPLRRSGDRHNMGSGRSSYRRTAARHTP